MYLLGWNDLLDVTNLDLAVYALSTFDGSKSFGKWFLEFSLAI